MFSLNKAASDRVDRKGRKVLPDRVDLLVVLDLLEMTDLLDLPDLLGHLARQERTQQ
jgi:hypothetical protein